jgi:hypothetical protein
MSEKSTSKMISRPPSDHDGPNRSHYNISHLTRYVSADSSLRCCQPTASPPPMRRANRRRCERK